MDKLLHSKRCLLLLPRFAGKSTYAGIIYPVWRIGKNRQTSVLIITHTYQYSKGFLREICRIMETSQEYKHAFGELKPNKPNKWSENEIIVEGAEKQKDPTLAVLGVGASVIGRHPDIIILDDIIEQDTARSDTRRINVEHWYRKDLLPCLGPDSQLIVVGTRWRFNDLYSILLEDPAFDTLIIQALNQNNESYWPDLWSLDRLLTKKKEVGIYGWQSQFMNDPGLEEGAIFRPEWLTYYDTMPVLDTLRIVQGVDLAISEKEKADYFALVTVGFDAEKGMIYLLDYYRAHLDFPSQRKMIEAQAQAWRPTRIAIEEVAYQKALVQSMFPTLLPVVGVKQTKDKELKMQALTPYFESKQVRLPKNADDFLIELLQFPNSEHDDLLDAFEMAVRQLAQIWIQPRVDFGKVNV